MLDNASPSQQGSKAAMIAVDWTKFPVSRGNDHVAQAWSLHSVDLVDSEQPGKPDADKGAAAEAPETTGGAPDAACGTKEEAEQGDSKDKQAETKEKSEINVTEIGEFGEVLAFEVGGTTWTKSKAHEWKGVNADSKVMGIADFGRVRQKDGKLSTSGGEHDMERAILPREVDTTRLVEVAAEFSPVIDKNYQLLTKQGYAKQKYEPGKFANLGADGQPDGSFGVVGEDGYVSELTLANGRKFTDIKHDLYGNVQSYTDTGAYSYNRRESGAEYPVWDITEVRTGKNIDPTEPNHDVHFTKSGAYFPYRMKSHDGYVDVVNSSGHNLVTERNFDGFLSTGWTTGIRGSRFSMFKEHQGDNRGQVTVNLPGVSAILKNGVVTQTYVTDFPRVKNEEPTTPQR